MTRGGTLELYARHHLTRARSRQRRTHAVARDARVVEVAEAAGEQSGAGARRGILRTSGTRISQRLHHIKQVEEFRANAERHALTDLEDLADAARNRRTPLSTEVVVVDDIAARNAWVLVLPGRGIQNSLLGRIDAAAVDVLGVQRHARNPGHSRITRGQITADRIARGWRPKQNADLIRAQAGDSPVGQQRLGNPVVLDRANRRYCVIHTEAEDVRKV